MVNGHITVADTRGGDDWAPSLLGLYFFSLFVYHKIGLKANNILIVLILLITHKAVGSNKLQVK